MNLTSNEHLKVPNKFGKIDLAKLIIKNLHLTINSFLKTQIKFIMINHNKNLMRFGKINKHHNLILI